VEWILTEGNRAGWKLDIFGLGALLEYTAADSLEVFVEDDELEGGAFVERPLAKNRNIAVLTEYHTREMVTAIERKLWNALKFGTTGEVDSKEGGAPAEGLLVVPPNYSKVGATQVELNGAVGEAFIL